MLLPYSTCSSFTYCSVGHRYRHCSHPILYLKIEPLFSAAECKNCLLRSITGRGVGQLGEHRTRWDKLEIILESYQLMIKEQVQHCKERRRQHMFQLK